MIMGRFSLLVALAAAATNASAQEWKPTEQEKTYRIDGATGPELYRAIGSAGPLLGGGVRTIAHTTFDLKWRRNYQPQADGSCRLVSGLPFLTITYTLPKPAQRLSGATAGNWQSFIEGMRVHEKVHGQYIREMTQATQSATVGLTVPDDRDCKKIRKDVARLAMEASVRQRDRSRDFDRIEMSNGGNVHRLILALVNGD